MAEKFDFLTVLDETTRVRVRQQMGREPFKRGQRIFHADEPADRLYFIDSGKVRIEGHAAHLGRSAAFAILGEGSFFGEVALVGTNSLRSASAVAIEDTSLRTLTRDAFHQLRSDNPKVNDILLDVMAQVTRRLSDGVVEGLYFDNYLRGARCIAALSEVYSRGGNTAEIRLPQVDLADLARMVRTSYNEVEVDAPRGLLERSRSRLVVHDRRELAAWIDAMMDQAEQHASELDGGMVPDYRLPVARQLVRECQNSEAEVSDDGVITISATIGDLSLATDAPATKVRGVLKDEPRSGGLGRSIVKATKGVIAVASLPALEARIVELERS